MKLKREIGGIPLIPAVLPISSEILFGIGIAAFMDKNIFHQLLHWHHFNDKSITAVGFVSVSLFHAFNQFETIAALIFFLNVYTIHQRELA